MEYFYKVYETMLGLLEEEFQVPGVESQFEEDSYCSREYEDMREAYARVCERLGGVDEDMDLEIMVTALENIQKELCYRCFEYGIRFVEEVNRFAAREK